MFPRRCDVLLLICYAGPEEYKGNMQRGLIPGALGRGGGYPVEALGTMRAQI